jgi:NADH:ubiquinone oxidoreductase subunit 6 (subunit J)
MMTLALLVIAVLTLASAAVALALRNLIHSALLLIASWAGIAAFYLWAGAEFVAFAQVLIYVGAISMVVLFAVLLTRHSRTEPAAAPAAGRRLLAALATGGALLGVLCGAIVRTPLKSSTASPPVLSVRDLGLQLMGPHAAALLVVGALLTVALIGAVVIAATERRREKEAVS